MKKDDRTYLQSFISDHCIAREPHGSTRLLKRRTGASYGKTEEYNTWMFVIKPLLYDARSMQIVSEHFFDSFTHKEVMHSQLSGLEHASVPLMTSLLLEGHRRSCYLNGFSIRKKQKTYGTRTWFEGTPNDKPAILVDDISSDTRNAFGGAMAVLQEHDIGFAPFTFCIVDLGDSDKFLFNDTKIKVRSIFTKKDFELDYYRYVEEKERAKLS